MTTSDYLADGRVDERNSSDLYPHPNPTLSQVVSAAVKQFGYSVLPGSDETDLRFYVIVSKELSVRCQVQVYEESRLAVAHFYCSDDLYQLEQKDAVNELCNRISQELPAALFYLQPDSDAAVMKQCLWTPDEVSVECVVRWLNTASFSLLVWNDAYDKVRNDNRDPESALAASLIENAIYSERVLKRTRRAIFKLVDGGGSHNKLESRRSMRISPT